MALNYIALLATITLVSFTFTESKWIESSQRPNGVDLNSLLNNPKIRDGILQSIVQNRGTSLEQIQNLIEAANGNLEEVVSGINAELNLDVLNLDGDVIRLNPVALKTLVKEAFQASLQKRIPNKPEWASSLQNSVEQQIDAGSPEFDAAIEQSAIPASVAQQQLVESRKKRSIQARDGFDLVQIVTDLVTSILQDQFGTLINGLLNNLKNVVSGFLIVTPPGNAIGDFLAGMVNFVLKELLQVITVIQESIVGSTNNGTAARRKREVDLAGSVDEIINNNGGLLDGIVRPVLSLLSGILTPIHNFVVNLANNIFATLEGVLGSILTTRIRAVTIALIDLLLPSIQ